MSLISAITSRGHMRFMIEEKGEVNASEVFIEFLRRLMFEANNKIFLIVYRGPAHIAKKTRAFVAGLGGNLRLFYLPPYVPDRNLINWSGSISKLTWLDEPLLPVSRTLERK